jgi:DNA-3-methyladenine glycosylase II
MSGRRAGQSHGAEQQLMLPAGYRMTEFWGFHRRDALRLSECDLQDGAITRMHKGLMWKGRPTLLTLELTQQCEGASVVQARWRLPADAGAITGMDDVLAAMLRRMFGLSQDVGEFERRFGRHARVVHAGGCPAGAAGRGGFARRRLFAEQDADAAPAGPGRAVG